MTARFYVPDLEPISGVARLSRTESHHLVKVLRASVGDPIQVFDGRGIEWSARIEAMRPDGVEVSLLEPLPTLQPAVSITVAQAVLKSDGMDNVIRDCTMLGVVAFEPFIAARTTVKAASLAHAPERWRRIALSSAKQCGVARLPEIREVVGFEQWLGDRVAGPTFMLVEPAAANGSTTVRELAAQPALSQATLVVGPEGGWTEHERVRAVAAGCIPLSLGAMTLRAAAVPLAATAALLAIWAE
jgi:16S rRNA (uracil1498-N3)-methyltransferase